MRLTSSSIFTLGLLASAAVSQADPMSMNIPAATMTNVVKELSEKTGQTYEVLPSLAGEVLHLSFKNLEAEAVRAQIATTLRATWKETAKGWRLVPSDQNWRDVRKEHLAKTVSILQKALETRLKDMPESLTADDLKKLDQMQAGMREGRAPGGDWASAIGKMNGLVPGNRAAIRCVQAVDLNVLAAMPAGSRRVFSLSPTQMQSVLGNGAKKAATDALSEFAVFESNNPRTDREERTMMMFGGGGGFASPTRLVNQGPVKNVIVAVRRSLESLSFSIEVTAYNAQDQVVFGGSEFLSENGGGNIRFGVSMGPGSESTNGKIKFSEDSIAAMKAMMRSRSADGFGFAAIEMAPGGRGGRAIQMSMPFLDSDSGTVKLSDGLRAKLLRPDLHDPLSHHVAESLTHLVGDTNKPVIALLPDTLTQQISTCVTETSSVELIRKDWTSAGMVETTRDGWIVFEPTKLTEAVDTRFDRLSLTSALNELAKSSIWRLDGKAVYYASRPRTASTNFDLALIGSLHPNANAVPTPFGANYDFMRLWGMLSATERRTLLAGGELPLRSFASEVRGVLANIVFDSQGGPTRSNPEAGSRGPGGGPSFPGAQDRGIERTSVLATGLPSVGVLRLKSKLEPAALARYDSGAVRAYNAATVYGIRGQNSMGGRVNIVSPIALATVQDYADAQFETLEFEVVLMPQYSMQGRLQDVNFGKTPAFGPYEKLSGEFQAEVKEIEKAVAAAEASGAPGAPPRGPRTSP